MVKTILVYSYPTSLHSAYWSLIRHPPAGYRFLTMSHGPLAAISAFDSVNILLLLNQKLVKRFVNTVVLKDYLYKYKKLPPADLLYSAGYLVLRKQPWVLSLIEHVTSMTGYDTRRFIKRRHFIREVLRKPWCHFILPNNQNTKRQIHYWFRDRAIDRKVRIVYNAIDTTEFDRFRQRHPAARRIPGPPVRFLFVGSVQCRHRSAFIGKGGLIAIRVFEELSKHTDDLHLTVVADVDPATAKRMARIKTVTHVPLLERDQLYLHYLSSDYFFSPAFGVPIASSLEALACGLPIVTFRAYFNPEYFTHEKDAILLEPPPIPFLQEGYLLPHDASKGADFVHALETVDDAFIRKTARALWSFARDRSLLRDLSANAYQLVKKGKFSLTHRNTILKEIFDRATADPLIREEAP